MDDMGADPLTWCAEWQQTATCDRLWVLDGQGLLVGFYDVATGGVVCCRPGAGAHLDAFLRGWYAATFAAPAAWPVAQASPVDVWVGQPQLVGLPEPGPIPATIAPWASPQATQPAVYGVPASAQAPLQAPNGAGAQDAGRLGRRPATVPGADEPVAGFVERMFSSGAATPRRVQQR